MKTSTKLGLIGIGASLIVQIALGIWEIRDYRKGKRRIAEHDAKMIAEAVVTKQEELKLAKKKTPKTVVKEEN
jgi:cytochrome oxidase assembly protein ShyY1